MPAEARAACTGRARDDVREAQLVARVRAERVVRHELVGDLPGQRRVEPARHVDRRQFVALDVRIGGELGALDAPGRPVRCRTAS